MRAAEAKVKAEVSSAVESGGVGAETLTRRDSQKFAEVCEGLLARGYKVRFRGQGSSMRPNILEDDAMVMAPIGGVLRRGDGPGGLGVAGVGGLQRSAVRRGEVVLTRGAEGLRVHRVVEVDDFGSAVVTRGDAGQENDPSVDGALALGRIVAVEREGREIGTVGVAARMRASVNCAALRMRMGFWNRTARILSYVFPAALILLLCLVAGVAPAGAAPSADMAITDVVGSTTALQGGTITYTITVTNNGPSTAAAPSWTLTTPTGTTFASVTPPSGWTCPTQPAVGGTGTVKCTDGSTFASGATAAVSTLVVNVPTTATVGSTIAGTAVTVSSTTTDPTAANNTATPATVTVAAGANLSITDVPNSTSVPQGGNINYTVTITNNGPSGATTPSWTTSTPTGTTFASVNVPGGWSCGTRPVVGGTGTVTCTATSNLANAGTASFTLIVTVPTTATVGATIPGNAATVSSTTGDPNPGSNTATPATVTVVTGANLTISETPGSTSVIQGGAITYTITVTNSGPSAAAAPSWTLTTPTSTTFASVTPPAGWTCPTKPAAGGTGTVTCTDGSSLANAGTATATMVVNVATTVTVGTTINNSATVSSATADPNMNNTGTAATVTVVAGADLAITDTAGSGTVVSGGTITYTVVVTNNGPSTAALPSWTTTTPSNTTFASVTPSAGWTCTNPTVGGTGTVTCTEGSNLAKNGTGTFTMVVNVPTSVTVGTVITAAAATVSSTTGDPTPGNNSATPATVTVVANADLGISLSANPTAANAGGNVGFTAVVTNNGAAAANAPVFTLTTPANTAFASVTPASGWTCSTPAVGATGTITCTDGSNLANAGTATIVVNLTVASTATDASTITTAASVASTTGDTNTANNSASATVTVAAPADLGITQTASAAVVAAGTNVTYTVKVTNNGPNQSQNAVFYENIPANTNYQSMGTVPSGWSCTTPAVGGTGNISCAIASLANAATATFTVTLQVNAATAAETAIQNVTSVTSNTTSDPTAANNTSTTTTLVGITGDADLQLSLSATPNPVFVSSTLVYTVAVQNLGVASATGTSISDTLPGAATFVSATASQGSCGQALGIVTCTLGTLAAGNAATATITVTAPAIATSLSNAASTTSGVPDPFLSNNSATLVTFVQPQSCATPAHDGAGGTLAGNINTYYAPSSAVVLTPGGTSVTLGAAAGSTTPIAVGDSLMIMQMQDAAINTTNTGAYGDGTPGDPATGYTTAKSAGRYEFITATSAVAVAGGTLTFTGAGPSNGLLNTYTEAAYSSATQGQRTFQVIRVPQYASATLASGVTAPAWNGAVGGVLVIDVSGQLTLGGVVSLDGIGFRGGAGRQLSGGTGSATDYVTLATAAINGSKGEGIAGTPRYIANPALTALTDTAVEGYVNGSYARGAAGNAGGGGTDASPSDNSENSGGGGGGNGSGGGNGGYAWNTSSLGNGFGGSAYPGSISNVIMGGGAGAGTTNNGTADPANANPTGINSSGAAGGGIIIIHAGTVVGTGTLTANGQTALNVLNDGAGGGGAGGSIELLALSGGISGATLSANGGNGGNTWLTSNSGGAYPGSRHGPGGGGGGGVILTSSPPATGSVAPGVNGVSTSVRDSYGATPGLGNGILSTNLGMEGFTQTPGNRPGAQCAVADLVVTNSGSPNPVLPGGNITYAQTVNNNGPQSALNAVFSEAIPNSTTFVSLAVPSGWTCTTPAVGAVGNISCTNPTVGVNAVASFALVVQVGAGVTNGTTITDTDSISSATDDNTLANNTATVNTLVSAASNADIAVTNAASPTTVAAGSTITYTQSLVNNGPATATTVTFSEAIPTNSTFASLSKPAGWTCTTPAVGATGNVNCSIASLASGGTGAFSLTVNVPAATAAGTVIVDTDMGSSAVTDPNNSNNAATVSSTTVAPPGTADMAVTLSAVPNTVLAGGQISYTATVTNNGPAAATTATFVDTIPANTTFVSDSVPGGWTCTTSATQVSCTNPSVAVGASSQFGLVFMVNNGVAPPTVISNTVTTGSAVTDSLPGNNSATVLTAVSSPTQADLVITKTGSPDPVNQGDNLVYTITVANNGPASATSVVVSDPLPLAVTYVSASATAGTCTQASGTVTCNLGTLTNGQVVTIAINVTATTMSTSSFAVNTASVSSATSDPDLTNNSATFTSTVAAPNVVQLVYLSARPRYEALAGGAYGPAAQSGVLLEWKTREEIRNLGFNVYREDGLGRHRVNPSIIAGAALFVRGGRPQHGAKTYQWIDPAGTAESSYVLEDVDLNGTRMEHGPVNVEASSSSSGANHVGTHAAARANNSALLTELNRMGASEVAANGSGANRYAAARSGGGVSGVGGASGRVLSLPRPTLQKVVPGEFRAQLDGVAAVKIAVRSEGWYRVSGAELIGAGLEADADARSLQLYAEGIEQPMLVTGRGFGTLAAGDSIQFYGTGIDTPYSDTRVYWLVKGARPGKRIGFVDATNSGTAYGSQGFPFTVVREDRTTYFATLLNGEDNDNFFGATVTSEPVQQVLNVANHASSSALPASVDVALQGATDGQPHRVSVTFNGASIGELDFTGQMLVTKTLPIDSSLLVEGANTFTLTALDGDNDVSVVESIALHYAHAYVADGNWLSATVNAGTTAHIGGFTSAQIHVVDITDPLGITVLNGAVKAEGATYGVSFVTRTGAPAGHTLLAFTDDQISAPAGLTYHAPDTLRARPGRADLIYIAHPDFVASLGPLKQLRESQQHEVSIVTAEQIFDAFNFGERSPYAIKEFLLEAEAKQARKLAGVLLVGDASLDPRNYLGFGYLDLVPTRMIETQAFKTASDDWFTDFQSNGFATIPTGRLPVRTAAEAALTVKKIVDYEQGAYAGTWNQQALVVADNNEGSNFSNNAESAAGTLQSVLSVNTILADGEDPDAVRERILAGLNEGALIVNYNGHGSTEQWSFANFLDDSSAGALSNGQKLPVYLLMDCLNGFFQDVYTQSLAESLMLSPGGGAVAVWASSGFTNAQPQGFLNQAMLSSLTQNQSVALGVAIMEAKSGVTDPDVRRTWILFGDPSMRLQFSGAAAGPARAGSRWGGGVRAGRNGGPAQRVRKLAGGSLPGGSLPE